MSVDMSSAFDTIDRQTILNVLGDAGCNEDEIRLARLLLTNTILRINVNGTLSIEFQTTTGAFCRVMLHQETYLLLLRLLP